MNHSGGPGVTREEFVVGLDIGTTKVCTLVGHSDGQGKINIVGVGVVPSRGLKKGVVIDVEDTVAAIRDSVDRAQHMAGIEIQGVIAGVTGDHIQSSNRKGTVTTSGVEGVISAEDVERVLQAASVDVPKDREIIHSLPRDFSVDGHKGVRRPIGMCGQRLEVETHVVTGTASFLQNVVQCVERAGLSVEALVLEPIATSEAVATTDERELGVALIDIGGGTSDIAVFLDGSIVFSDVLSVGGTHVTRDISIGLRTPLEIAERLKIERGVASSSLITHGEALEVVTAGSGERLRLPRAILGEIIEARMTELFEMARTSINGAGAQKRLPAGIVLTGGGALLPGAVELAQQVFELPVRLGKPIEITGWSDQVDTPQFATAVGLLRFALRQRAALASLQAGSQAGGAVAGLSSSGSYGSAKTVAAPTTNSDTRRVWDTPTANGQSSTASTSTASNGQNTIPEPTGLRTEAARADALKTEAAKTDAMKADAAQTEAARVEAARHNTPFDRFTRGTPAGDGADQEPSLWQKLFTRLRQLIGFDLS